MGGVPVRTPLLLEVLGWPPACVPSLWLCWPRGAGWDRDRGVPVFWVGILGGLGAFSFCLFGLTAIFISWDVTY